jgi:hypothetical protein
MSSRTLVLVALAGCSFDPQGGTETDGPPVDAPDGDAPDTDAPDLDAPDIDAPDLDAPDIDAPAIDAPDIDAPAIDAPIIDIVFLPPAHEMPGTGAVTIDSLTTIDTSANATPPNLGPGTSYTVATPTGGGPDILVLHTGSLTVNSTLRIVGRRPFAIVAGGAITVNGTIDASATGTATPGPSGALTDTGMGAGNPGRHITGVGTAGQTSADSGGGGASYGSLGGQGGDAFCAGGCIVDQTVPGGTAGPLYNATRTQLLGGSGGGSTPDATANCLGLDGGAGGGALLIYSAVSITVNGAGAIEANGGGGARGIDCMPSGSTSGGGGGSGGQIELQAPAYTVTGAIVANGGGGGGAADSNNGDGMAGSDGTNNSTPAAGGAGTLPNGGNGGAGAAGGSTAEGGQDMGSDQNGGGGGGGTGLITIRHQGSQPGVSTSPSASFVAY